jgi:hypothetical protein
MFRFVRRIGCGAFRYHAPADFVEKPAAEQAIVLVAREWLHRYTQLTSQLSSFPA